MCSLRSISGVCGTIPCKEESGAEALGVSRVKLVFAGVSGASALGVSRV